MTSPDDFLTATKNAAWTLSEEEQDRFKAIYSADAARRESEVKDLHWIANSDDGTDWCFECAEKKVAELIAANPDRGYVVDGGWRDDHDSIRHCEGCGCRLEGALTYCAAQQEIEYFMEYGFDPANDDECLTLDEIVNAIGLHLYQSDLIPDRENQEFRERHWQLGKLARRILEQRESGD